MMNRHDYLILGVALKGFYDDDYGEELEMAIYDCGLDMVHDWIHNEYTIVGKIIEYSEDECGFPLSLIDEHGFDSANKQSISQRLFKIFGNEYSPKLYLVTAWQ